MQSKSFLGYSPLGFHKVAYAEWGATSSKPPVICVHGLTRNGRDFDLLATHLQFTRTVFCPDVVGRGKSDWLADPMLYGYPQYLNDMTALIARSTQSENAQVDWVGTSMGGIIGMLLAAQPNTPVRKLVINDVGPFIPLTALKRISDYVSMVVEFADLAQLERHLRVIYAPFGITKDEDWTNLAANSYRTLPNGKLALAHDPGIAKNFVSLDKDVDFWNLYDQIRCPTLLLHGAQSDVLSAETALEMTQRGPKARLITLPNVGHAPALMEAGQVNVVTEFLAS
jgi:pimeloyl-ACP methyl ester carboxylesterase